MVGEDAARITQVIVVNDGEGTTSKHRDLVSAISKRSAFEYAKCPPRIRAQMRAPRPVSRRARAHVSAVPARSLPPLPSPHSFAPPPAPSPPTSHLHHPSPFGQRPRRMTVQ